MVDRFCGPWLLPGFCCPPPPRGTLGSDLCAHGLASVPSVGGGGAIVLLYRPSTPSSPPPPLFFSFEAWGFAVPSSYAHRPLASLPPSLSWGKCSLHTQPLSKVGFPFLFPWEPAFCRVGSTPRVLIDVGRGCISCSLLPPPPSFVLSRRIAVPFTLQFWVAAQATTHTGWGGREAAAPFYDYAYHFRSL